MRYSVYEITKEGSLTVLATFTGLAKAVALVLLLLLPSLSFAKDCSVTSTGATIADYHRSVELDLALAEAINSLERRDRFGVPNPDGHIGFETLGNSNSITYGGGLIDALSAFVQPWVRLVVNGRTGKTIRDWDNVSDLAWVDATSRLRNLKIGANSIGVIVSYMTLKEPHLNGWMTDQDITNHLNTIRLMRPNAKVVLLADMGYFGYRERKRLSTWENIVHEGHLLANRARTQVDVPEGMRVEYFPLVSDGIIPNPNTGVVWPCEYLQDDGIHPSLLSRAPIGENQAQRLRVDPVYAGLMK